MITCLLLLTVSLVSDPASAQARRIVIEEETLIGKVRKPEVTLFVTRQNLNTEYQLELRKSFLPRIAKSVEKKPF